MTAHEFTNVTGYILVDGVTQGFIDTDFSFETAMGKYVEQGSDTPAAHTHGLRAVSGKITKGWGMTSSFLYAWYNNQTEKTIVFYPVAGSTATYTLSGCSLKNLKSAIKAGGEDALIIDADFEGLSGSSGDV